MWSTIQPTQQMLAGHGHAVRNAAEGSFSHHTHLHLAVLAEWCSTSLSVDQCQRERERERESINSNVSCHTEKHGIQVPTLNVSVNNVTYRPAYKVLFVDLAPLEAFNLNWGQFIRLVCASCTAHFNSVSMIKVQTSNMVVYLCLGSQ